MASRPHVRLARRRQPGGQELVFIGTHLHADGLNAALTERLMTDGECLPARQPVPRLGRHGINDTCDHVRHEVVAGA